MNCGDLILARLPRRNHVEGGYGSRSNRIWGDAVSLQKSSEAYPRPEPGRRAALRMAPRAALPTLQTCPDHEERPDSQFVIWGWAPVGTCTFLEPVKAAQSQATACGTWLVERQRQGINTAKLPRVRW